MRQSDTGDGNADATRENTLLDALDGFGEKLDAKIGATVQAPGGSGELLSGGDLDTGFAWSTIKVPIVLRLLEDVGGPDGLNERQRADIDLAITASDNDAAARLFDDLSATYGGVGGASQAVTEVLSQAGDQRTEISTEGRGDFSAYGQTDWSLREQSRFMAALAGGCIADGASGRYLLEKMGQVTADTWGLGSVGEPAHWKGGWGPGLEGGYLVRQMGTVDVGGRQLVVTIAVEPNDGSFDSGTVAATGLAQRVVELAADAKLPERPC